LAKLGVNIDHVATVRQARGTIEPEPVLAASIAELAGADGITIHLREDRRHIQDRDLGILRKTVRTKLNLEMAATDEMVAIALEVRPDTVTLVPEKRQELTTEGGLEVKKAGPQLAQSIGKLRDGGILVSLFVDPLPDQIEAACKTGAEYIEIHTGSYAEAKSGQETEDRFEAILKGVKAANKLGLGINAGHGLDYWNIKRLLAIKEIEEYNIGHSIISRALITGLEKAVKDMVNLIEQGNK